MSVALLEKANEYMPKLIGALNSAVDFAIAGEEFSNDDSDLNKTDGLNLEELAQSSLMNALSAVAVSEASPELLALFIEAFQNLKAQRKIKTAKNSIPESAFEVATQMVFEESYNTSLFKSYRSKMTSVIEAYGDLSPELDQEAIEDIIEDIFFGIFDDGTIVDIALNLQEASERLPHVVDLYTNALLELLKDMYRDGIDKTKIDWKTQGVELKTRADRMKKEHASDNKTLYLVFDLAKDQREEILTSLVKELRKSIEVESKKYES